MVEDAEARLQSFLASREIEVKIAIKDWDDIALGLLFAIAFFIIPACEELYLKAVCFLRKRYARSKTSAQNIFDESSIKERIIL